MTKAESEYKSEYSLGDYLSELVTPIFTMVCDVNVGTPTATTSESAPTIATGGP